jgi:hypothetical protein
MTRWTETSVSIPIPPNPLYGHRQRPYSGKSWQNNHFAENSLRASFLDLQHHSNVPAYLRDITTQSKRVSSGD